jgi:hypothetical protein
VLRGLEILFSASPDYKSGLTEDFMFEMSEEEFTGWRSQFVTSNADRQGLRYHPFCFTEQGVTMLSCILNSDNAIAVNIRVIRIFAKMREMVGSHRMTVY